MLHSAGPRHRRIHKALIKASPPHESGFKGRHGKQKTPVWCGGSNRDGGHTSSSSSLLYPGRPFFMPMSVVSKGSSPALAPAGFPSRVTRPAQLCQSCCATQPQSQPVLQYRPGRLMIKRKDCRMNLISGVKLISSYLHLLQCTSSDFQEVCKYCDCVKQI